MYPNQLAPILKRHLMDDKLRKKTIFIEGPSGVGKSDMLHQLGVECEAVLRDKRFSQMDAVDFSGTPSRVEIGGKMYTTWSPPEWLIFPTDRLCIFLADEITSASREVGAASYQLFLDREVNGAKVPDNVLIVTAGNRVSDRGVINQLPMPLLNRMVKLTCEPHLDSWRDHVVKLGVDPRMIAWITYQPEYLHNFDPAQAAGSEPFCSPRSIVSAADYLDAPDEERVELLRGCLGKGGASACESFLRLYTRLPSRQEIETDPLGCRIPGDDALGERYAVAMMCSSVMERANFHKLWQYVDRLGAQFVVLAVKLAMARDTAIGTAKGYRDFTMKHSAVFERG